MYYCITSWFSALEMAIVVSDPLLPLFEPFARDSSEELLYNSLRIENDEIASLIFCSTVHSLASISFRLSTTSITFLPCCLSFLATWMHLTASMYTPTEDIVPTIGLAGLTLGLNLLGARLNPNVLYFDAALMLDVMKSLGFVFR